MGLGLRDLIINTIKEFQMYLRDHLFRQSNQGRQQQQFKKKSLAREMISLYLRYRNTGRKPNAAHPIESAISIQ